MVLALVSVFVLLFVLERAWPATRLPAVPGWKRRLAFAHLTQAAVVLFGAWSWGRWLRGASLFDLGRWPAAAAGGVAYFGSTLVWYAWHRARHEVPFLFRTFHQVHHSARRIEVLTSFYKHPLEQLADGLLGAAIAYPLLGLDASAVAVYVALAGIAELLYHANVRTPRWLGWFVQRPEMHRLHHARGVHAKNYADLPVWDMLFGTYENPDDVDVECGFAPEDEARVREMMAFVDVTRERAS